MPIKKKGPVKKTFSRSKPKPTAAEAAMPTAQEEKGSSLGLADLSARAALSTAQSEESKPPLVAGNTLSDVTPDETSTSSPMTGTEPDAPEASPTYTAQPLAEEPSEPVINLGVTSPDTTVGDAQAAQTMPETEIPEQTAVAQDEAGTSADQPSVSTAFDAPIESDAPGGSKKKILITLLVIGVLAGVLIGTNYFSYQLGMQMGKQQANKSTQKQSQADSDTTRVPSPTSAPVKRDAYTIDVLNGSGIPGEAAKVKQLLENEKFTIETTGNADNPSYDKTLIKVKKSVSSSFVADLNTVLSKSYAVQATSGVLEESAATDVVVVVGSSPAQ